MKSKGGASVNQRFATLLAALAIMAGATALHAQTASGDHILHPVGDHFELNGRRVQIISGAIHYARVPRAYWRDRLKKAKAMGLNTIETYVFWNVHDAGPDAGPDRYDFSGQNDVAEFIREAQQEGLYVILRPGPYVCAEWEFGGYPAWLLRDPSIKVRTSDPAFIAAASKWLHRLGEELAPLQSGNDGPIIATQVENEYGSFGNDHAYMEQIHRILVDAGFTKSMLYTADGADELPNGSLPELPAVINFGTGDAKEEFAKLAKLRPTGPRMCGEYWAGWFDHWGAPHNTADAKVEADELKWMLDQGYSVNLYMFHGGTSFGWMNGANTNGKAYEPDVTSYDYDAPVSESGQLTPKYFLLRDAIRQATSKEPPVPPEPIPARAFAAIHLVNSAPLWKTLPQPTLSEWILPMEALGQSYGYILYRTSVEAGVGAAQSGELKPAELKLDELHSYAQVYLDGKLVGTLDRRLAQSTLALTIPHDRTRLDVLVENTGRVNFGHQFPEERAGITHQVTLAGKPLTGWAIYPLPMLQSDRLPVAKTACEGACFYEGDLDVDQPADTFLDTRGLGKGMVWVNGTPLGRFWKIGPQGALYLPAPLLKPGRNRIVVFDLEGRANPTLTLSDKPILDVRQ
jgi:beta-galactosidase